MRVTFGDPGEGVSVLVTNTVERADRTYVSCMNVTACVEPTHSNDNYVIGKQELCCIDPKPDE